MSMSFSERVYNRNHGRDLVGGTGNVCPRGGGHNMRCSPHFFLSGFVFGEVPKTSDVCHVLCKVLIMLDVTHSQVYVETEFGVVSLILLIYQL